MCRTPLHRPSGTLGVSTAAKAAGVIDFVAPVIADVRRAGLYVTEALVTQVLDRFGE